MTASFSGMFVNRASKGPGTWFRGFFNARSKACEYQQSSSCSSRKRTLATRRSAAQATSNNALSNENSIFARALKDGSICSWKVTYLEKYYVLPLKHFHGLLEVLCASCVAAHEAQAHPVCLSGTSLWRCMMRTAGQTRSIAKLEARRQLP